jgi:hypothetical protein
VLRGSHGDVAVVEPDASFAERSMSEHGNRSGTACVHAPSVDIGLGPPSTDRVGTGRSRRSSPRPGEPVTWRRAAWTVAAAVVEQVAEHHRDIAVDSGVSDRDTEFNSAHDRVGNNSGGQGRRLGHRAPRQVGDTA